MLRRLILVVLLGAAILGVVVWQADLWFQAAPTEEPPTATASAAAETTLIGKPLYPPVDTPAAILPSPAQTGPEPIVIPEGRLTVIDKQDVPCQREGVLLVIGTLIEPGQQVSPEQLVTLRIGGQDKQFRRLKEGDTVQAGQLVAYLDDQLDRDDWAIKNARLTSSRADLEAAIKTSEEKKSRYDTQLHLSREGRGITAEEDVRAAKLAWDQAAYDVVSKREAVALAERELSQSETLLRMHQVRAATPGVIKTIYRNPGEAVKMYEPVLQVHNLARLRVEALVDAQFLPRLRTGMKVTIEPALPEAAQQTLVGHVQEITSVAVSKDPNSPLVVSASEDCTLRIWSLTDSHAVVVQHPAPVLAVACTPPGSESNLCLSGASDGKGRLWKLDGKIGELALELQGQHDGAITSVAFSPDGKVCVTGGDDREICLWDTATGALRYHFPAGHRNAVTSLRFTPRSQLVSAGHDNTLRLWTVGEDGARLEATFDRRSGDVAYLDASADGRRSLYDQGDTLRLLSLPEGSTEGILQNSSGAHFTSFARFSPDNRMILTAAAGEGQAQLWSPPTPAHRAAPLRQLVATEPFVATCAAFAPDSSFVVVGTREKEVRVWRVPPAEQMEHGLQGTVTLIERAVESNTRQVRICAELPNPDGKLLPGTTATIVISPDEPWPLERFADGIHF